MRPTKVSGTKVSNTVMECGKVSMETPTLANGRILKQMDMESTCGKMEISTRESGEHVLNMAKAVICLAMEMCT